MISFIFIGDLQYCPYINKYIDILNDNDLDYTVYFWNRSNYEIDVPYKYKCWQQKSELSKGKVSKFIDFIKYAKWLNKNLKHDNPDKIIFLSTLSIMLISPRILKSYKNKYILDIRDYSYEKYMIYRSIIVKYIKKSYFCCISSPAFKNFLTDDYSYQIAHNFNKNLISNDFVFKKKNKDEVIKIVWTGVMRYFEYQKQFIQLLGNDNRFELHYYGSGPELKLYQEFAKQFNNVYIHGKYDNTKKLELLLNCDIINNCYGSRNKRLLKYAVSNKYYDGVIFRIPQIVESGNYKSKLVSENKLGFICDLDSKDFANKLYTAYHDIDEDVFNNNCQKLIYDILKDDAKYEKAIKEFINDEV